MMKNLQERQPVAIARRCKQETRKHPAWCRLLGDTVNVVPGAGTKERLNGGWWKVGFGENHRLFSAASFILSQY
jgi:hypothetical protein